jgi:hypothetical protein
MFAVAVGLLFRQFLCLKLQRVQEGVRDEDDLALGSFGAGTHSDGMQYHRYDDGEERR